MQSPSCQCAGRDRAMGIKLNIDTRSQNRTTERAISTAHSERWEIDPETNNLVIHYAGGGVAVFNANEWKAFAAL